MVGLGRSVRIYMAEGSVLGIKQAEIFNRTIQAVAFPRARLPEIRDWPETQRPGIYFLLGFDENGNNAAYIGEAQDVYSRIKQQVVQEFWEECIIFTNKDENINSKYLEARLIGIAKYSQRYSLKNSKEETVGKLSRSDRDAMEEILDDIKVLVGILGHKVLEHFVNTTSPVKVKVKSDQDIITIGENILLGREFQFDSRTFRARAQYTDEGILVLEG